MTDADHEFMAAALAEARSGAAAGGIPIGAVLVRDGVVIGRGHNQRVQRGDPVLHAEIDCLRAAGRLSASDYRRCTMYTSLSPCAMCSGAIALFGIPRVVIGENRTFRGEEDWLAARGVTLRNLQLDEATALMRAFIAAHPELWCEDIGEIDLNDRSAPPAE